jgi:hypothetical protein
MILLDWTRMGRSYCLAGVVVQDGQYRVIRPLQARNRDAPVRNFGWSAYHMDGHSRWEVFELIGPEPAPGQRPHLEDIWVRSLQPRRALASPAQRRAVLNATMTSSDRPLFGHPLQQTRTAAYLAPGTGHRSLVTVTVPGRHLRFTAAWRDGVPEPDYRVTLPLPGGAERSLPVKDHFLLQRAELAGTELDSRIRALSDAVGRMGERVAVRLGLSRAFPATPHRGEGVCWLMADGFFSLSDPQP